MIPLTPLEISSISVISGLAGWIINRIFSGKNFVKRDICTIVHRNIDETLQRIEKKIDKMNGDS